MNETSIDDMPPGNGSWQDAEELRKWSFLRRTPQQRLDWLVGALAFKYSLPGRPLSAPDK